MGWAVSPELLTAEQASVAALRASEQRFRLAFETAAVGMARIEIRSGQWLDVNDAFCTLLGYSRAELLASRCSVVTHPADAGTAFLDRLAAGEAPSFATEKRYVHRDGQVVWTSLTLTMVRGTSGEPDFALAVVEDISGRRLKMLETQEAQSRQAFLLALADRLRPIWNPVEVTSITAEMLGRHLGVAQAGYCEVDKTGLLGLVHRDWNDGRLPSVVGQWRLADFGEDLQAELRAGSAIAVCDIVTDPRTSAPDNLAAFAELGIKAVLCVPLVRNGRLRAILFLHDAEAREWSAGDRLLVEAVSERTWAALEWARAEAARHATEDRLRAITDALPQIVWSTRADGFHDYYNRRWYEFTGMPDGSTDGDGWNGLFHPDDQPLAWERWRHSLATGEPYEIEYRLRHHSGEYRWTLGRALPMRDEFGTIVRWMGTCTDLQQVVEAREVLARSRTELEQQVAQRTAELRQANARLRSEMQRREKAQAALVQSQKLEALGQLTAGVAHDFNNAIAAIAGAFSIIERRTDDPRILDIANHGLKAAWRGDALVKQMLMFARQQTLAPRTIQLCDLFDEVGPLMRRSTGERIRLSIECEAGLPAIHADPIQLESALINLAVNARDAIAGEGELRIEVAECPLDLPARPPELGGARAVSIRVVDSGSGMSPEILQRVTEPFFTTKQAGLGTGLGLSMVHGFMQQSGGALRIASRVGEGTAITLFLPVSEGEEQPGPSMPAANDVDMRHHGNANILVVDDDSAVRSITAAELGDLGYAVTEAASGAEALGKLSGTPAIDLVLADVVMPDLDGPGLLAAMRGMGNALPVLFMSGYSGWPGIPDNVIIEKPFSRDELAARILRALGRLDEQTGAPDDRLDRMETRFRAEILRPVLRRWRREAAGRELPDLAAFNFKGLGVADRLAIVSVDLTRLPIAFRIESTGERITGMAGAVVPGMHVPVTGAQVPGTVEAAYRRCAQSRRPGYEYARFDLGDGQPVVFERLLLPFAAAGPGSVVLASIVFLEGLATGGAGEEPAS